MPLSSISVGTVFCILCNDNDDSNDSDGSNDNTLSLDDRVVSSNFSLDDTVIAPSVDAVAKRGVIEER